MTAPPVVRLELVEVRQLCGLLEKVAEWCHRPGGEAALAAALGLPSTSVATVAVVVGAVERWARQLDERRGAVEAAEGCDSYGEPLA